jgi:threonine aldolase
MSLDFTSDNVTGASEPVLAAIVAANGGAEPAYGADSVTREIEARFATLFEREVAVFLVASGTAANALALAAAVSPWGSCVCHAEAHVAEDECGAPEFFTHGAKLLGVSGVGGKLEAGTVAAFLDGLPRAEKQMPAQCLSVSQATEAGLVYTLPEIAALAGVAHARGLAVHMDGARFANALVALGCTPADMTWRSGVDILSFGATKNGCLAAEAVVVFDERLAGSLRYRRKRSGHTLSKGRFLAAQFRGYFADDHWLDNARRANAAARRLSAGLSACPDIRLAWPTDANEVFAILPGSVDRALRGAGARYHAWASGSLPDGVSIGPDDSFVRLVTSYATTEADVDALLRAVRDATSGRAA